MAQYFHVEQLFTGKKLLTDVILTVENGKITNLVNSKKSDHLAQSQRLSGLLVAGFIDVQVNGGGGGFFNADPTVKCLNKIVHAHSQFGSTGLMPTLITDSLENMQKAANAISAAVETNTAGVLGVHFEGPHLSYIKKGTHSEKFIRDISEAEFDIYARQDLGIKMITLAPENVTIADIKRLISYDVKVCIGHTNASFECTKEALKAGANGFTHLFNAMSAFTSREPGVVGAALSDKNSWCGLIVDGHHVHPESAKLAINIKPQGKIILVTDAMPPVGTQDTEFDFFDGRTVIRTGDRLNSSTGELAGSVLDMASAVRNTINTLDISLAEAIRMATIYPAEYLGLSHRKGQIAVGFDADFVLLNDNQQVLETYIAGEKINH